MSIQNDLKPSKGALSTPRARHVTPQTEIHVPPYANHVPSLRIRWDEKKVKITPNEVRKQLTEGHPSIQTVGDSKSVGMTTWMMVPGQERIVAKRVKEILSSAT